MTTNADLFLKRLRASEFLHGLDESALRQIAESAAWKVYPPNAVIFWEGDNESNLYFLQYGSLKAMKTSPDGREQVLRFLYAGEVFNEVGAPSSSRKSRN